MNIVAPEQIIIYFIDLIFIFFSVIFLKTSITMIRRFNFNSSTTFQYTLEKKNTLISAVVSFLILLKLPLIFFFLYLLDSLSSSIPGAMCAVGVLNSTPYGAYLIILKVTILFVLGYWFYINKFDLQTYGFKYTKLKYRLLIFITLLIILEFLLEINLFNNISPEKIVSCCGSVFGGELRQFSTFLINIENSLSVLAIIVVFVVMTLAFMFKKYRLYGFTVFFFLLTAIYSLIDFFSTYIYELPTHRCPFCILQRDYNHIGYVLYFLLFFGTFYGSNLLVLSNITSEKTKRVWINISYAMCLIYILIVSFYVLKYYIGNGVWLTD
ncbi:hypothetical protein DSN97_03205 [Deferribacteraceae bacterium V6Fe1]|nr:hypothetical protein DSN97_03205 [Deferribacteraceae bacterium V6Fe1]